MKTNRLNSWLTAILWIKIVFTSVSVISGIVTCLSNDMTVFDSIQIVLAIVAIGGAYWIIQENRNGFYLICVSNLLLALFSYIQYTNLNPDEFGYMFSVVQTAVLKGVWSGIGQVIFIMLLMLLKKDGKNAYQILWNY